MAEFEVPAAPGSAMGRAGRRQGQLRGSGERQLELELESRYAALVDCPFGGLSLSIAESESSHMACRARVLRAVREGRRAPTSWRHHR